MCGEAAFMNVVTPWMTTSKQLQRMSPCACTLCHWHENSIIPQKVCGAFEVTGKNIRRRTQWHNSVGTRAWMFKVHSLHEKEKPSKRLLCQIRNPTQVAALVVSHLDWNLPKEDKQAPLYKHANEVKGERVKKKEREWGQDRIQWQWRKTQSTDQKKQLKPRKFKLVLLFCFGKNCDIKNESVSGIWSMSEQNFKGGKASWTFVYI